MGRRILLLCALVLLPAALVLLSPIFTMAPGGEEPSVPHAPSALDQGPEPGLLSAGRAGTQSAPGPDETAGEAEGEWVHPEWAVNEDWEHTLEPALPPVLAAVLAEAESHRVSSGASPATPVPVVLSTGRVIIDHKRWTATGELVLVNLDVHAVSLRGWAVLLTGPNRWVNLPDQVLLPGARLAVYCQDGPTGEAVLYDSEGAMLPAAECDQVSCSD